jgi:hypothetical protein
MNKQEFDELCEKWLEETGFRSDGGTDNLAFQKLIGAGKDILPWVFNRIMFDDRAWWDLIAYGIPGIQPWPDMARGRVYIQNAYWIVWGIENGYITTESVDLNGCRTISEKYFNLWREIKDKK